MVRQNNEDRFHFDPDRGIFLVVDGIGGQAAGEQAADTAVNRVRARLERQTGTPEQRIREAITVANNEILQQSAGNPEWKGMACVLTVALADNGSATIGHVGDSRLYKIHRGQVSKITHDHSPVGEREDRGEITEAEAMRHPRRNEVYRDVGTEEHAPDDPDFIEVLHIPFEPDSALLLCSDGLSDQVASADILRSVVAHAGDPSGAVTELINLANRAGGKDNVTVLIVEGDQFAVARQAPVDAAAPAKRGGSPLSGRFAVFVYGLLFAALVCAGLLYYGVLRLPAPVVPPPRVLVVGPGGFSRISEAIAAARAGDTVEVSMNEYQEQLQLKNGVTVAGRMPDKPILRAAPAAAASSAILAEGIEHARVSGFRILASEKEPLAAGVIIADSNIELQDTEIEGAAVGIEIRGNSKPVLRADFVHDCRDGGVRISGESAPWLLYNVIVHNGRHTRDPKETAAPGVRIEAPARPVLIGNTFGDNAGGPVIFPEGMDSAAIMKFNYLLPATPPARTRPGAH
jgi:serine/threonine protein phosphatase PrpC